MGRSFRYDDEANFGSYNPLTLFACEECGRSVRNGVFEDDVDGFTYYLCPVCARSIRTTSLQRSFA